MKPIELASVMVLIAVLIASCNGLNSDHEPMQDPACEDGFTGQTWTGHIFWKDDLAREVYSVLLFYETPCRGYTLFAHEFGDVHYQSTVDNAYTVEVREPPMCIYGYSITLGGGQSYNVGIQQLLDSLAAMKEDFDPFRYKDWSDDVLEPCCCLFEGKWQDFMPDTIWID